MPKITASKYCLIWSINIVISLIILKRIYWDFHISVRNISFPSPINVESHSPTNVESYNLSFGDLAFSLTHRPVLISFVTVLAHRLQILSILTRSYRCEFCDFKTRLIGRCFHIFINNV